MGFSEKELNNIAHSLETKHWNVSDGQRDCVRKLIEQARANTNQNTKIYYATNSNGWTSGYFINKSNADAVAEENNKLNEEFKGQKDVDTSPWTVDFITTED